MALILLNPTVRRLDQTLDRLSVGVNPGHNAPQGGATLATALRVSDYLPAIDTAAV